ncbi:MAG: hypothetical protein PVI57_12500, partial [Gemmatimonadota bacterium]
MDGSRDRRRSAVRRTTSFLAELKRRKVYRVAAAYVVVAAGTLQLLDVILPSSRMPGWADELFLGLAVLGFPLAVVLAWAFDVTPEGVRRASEQESPVEPEPDGTPLGEKGMREEWHDLRVLAVLPFEDLGGSEAAGPFAAGLHGDLLTELSRLSALTVISRTSVMDYRGGGKTLGEMARELGVGTVVEGAVQHAAGRVRLNVQLVDAVRGVQRWAGQYERELSAESIFELQSELAREIATRLRVELTPAEKERVSRTPTRDLEAYRLFAQGREHLDQRTEEEVHRALDRFGDAIRLDPDYGLAWAGLAEALSLIEYYGYAVPSGTPDALDAARRGVELAPQTGEAYTALGITWSQRREGPPALEALERAVELSPSDAEAYSWLAWLRLVLGEPEKAVRPAARGVELNPRAPAALVFHAETRLATGEAGVALREAIRARDLQPGYELARFVEALALYHLDRFVDARAVLEEILPRARGRGTPSRP